MPKNLSELNVIIADDEADICSMVKFALQALGISKIYAAADGQVAWEQFRESGDKFNLIISDWMMPEMSGLDFLQRVREHDTKVPFVMLTIMNGKDHIAKAAESGVTGFIGKPFTLTDFQRHIRRITDRIEAV